VAASQPDAGDTGSDHDAAAAPPPNRWLLPRGAGWLLARLDVRLAGAGASVAVPLRRHGALAVRLTLPPGLAVVGCADADVPGGVVLSLDTPPVTLALLRTGSPPPAAGQAAGSAAALDQVGAAGERVAGVSAVVALQLTVSRQQDTRVGLRLPMLSANADLAGLVAALGQHRPAVPPRAAAAVASPAPTLPVLLHRLCGRLRGAEVSATLASLSLVHGQQCLVASVSALQAAVSRQCAPGSSRRGALAVDCHVACEGARAVSGETELLSVSALALQAAATATSPGDRRLQRASLDVTVGAAAAIGGPAQRAEGAWLAQQWLAQLAALRPAPPALAVPVAAPSPTSSTSTSTSRTPSLAGRLPLSFTLSAAATSLRSTVLTAAGEVGAVCTLTGLHAEASSSSAERPATADDSHEEGDAAVQPVAARVDGGAAAPVLLTGGLAGAVVCAADADVLVVADAKASVDLRLPPPAAASASASAPRPLLLAADVEASIASVAVGLQPPSVAALRRLMDDVGLRPPSRATAEGPPASTVPAVAAVAPLGPTPTIALRLRAERLALRAGCGDGGAAAGVEVTVDGAALAGTLQPPPAGATPDGHAARSAAAAPVDAAPPGLRGTLAAWGVCVRQQGVGLPPVTRLGRGTGLTVAWTPAACAVASEPVGVEWCPSAHLLVADVVAGLAAAAGGSTLGGTRCPPAPVPIPAPAPDGAGTRPARAVRRILPATPDTAGAPVPPRARAAAASGGVGAALGVEVGVSVAVAGVTVTAVVSDSTTVVVVVEAVHARPWAGPAAVLGSAASISLAINAAPLVHLRDLKVRRPPLSSLAEVLATFAAADADMLYGAVTGGSSVLLDARVIAVRVTVPHAFPLGQCVEDCKRMLKLVKGVHGIKPTVYADGILPSPVRLPPPPSQYPVMPPFFTVLGWTVVSGIGVKGVLSSRAIPYPSLDPKFVGMPRPLMLAVCQRGAAGGRLRCHPRRQSLRESPGPQLRSHGRRVSRTGGWGTTRDRVLGLDLG